MAHDDGRNAAAGRAVVAVNVAPADAAGGYANENFAGAGSWIGKLGEFELFVLREQKRFHARLNPIELQTRRYSSADGSAEKT